MSQAVDSPVVVLFEDRPKQGMVFQLNLSIYLDARVVRADTVKDLKKAISNSDGVQLVITRAKYKGAPLAPKILELLQTSGISIPVIALGDEKVLPGLTVVDDENSVKPTLQAAARILGITAKQMVSKQRSDTYEIAPEFLNTLFTFPCDIFGNAGKGLMKLFSAGDIVPRPKVAKLVKEGRPLVIESFERLKVANAVTEQALKVAEDLTTEPGLPTEQKMNLLAASLDMVAAQFQSAGMDEETVKLANASIKAVEKIAANATSVGSLVKQLLDAQGGYRYAHCQLITFLGFHVIKMMDWWGEDQRTILSQAAFYHDISLTTDEQAQVRTAKMAADLTALEPEIGEKLLTHSQLAARELQTAPEISPEVVRVVIQHHGSPVGRGFSTDIAKMDILAKTFILAEEWCDYLMDLAQHDKLADNDTRIKELKAVYKDDQSQQIIETFRYLDPEAFAYDMLSSKEVDFAASLVSGGTAGSEAQSIVVPIKPAAEPVTHISAAVTEEEVRRLVSGGKTDEEARTIVKAGAVEEEVKRLVKGGKTEQEARTIVKASKPEKELRRVVRGELSVDEEALIVKASKEPKLADLTRVKGPNGDKARALLEKISEKKPNATVEEVETLLKAGGVVMDDETRLAASSALEEELRQIVKASPKEVDVGKTIKSVTDVRLDEKVTVKGGKPQDLIDRSITVIKASPADKERELKMKALEGSSELMKFAISGAADKVAEKLAANAGVEMRKTDAEGRTAVHYAAMGGSVAVLKFLLEKGGSLNAVDSKRRSPLFFAALYKHNEAFDFLMAQGSKIAQQAMGGMTIAMIGASSGNLHVLKIALQKGVRADTKDHGGKTAMDYAKQAKNTEAIAFLEELATAKPAAAAAPVAKAAGG